MSEDQVSGLRHLMTQRKTRELRCRLFPMMMQQTWWPFARREGVQASAALFQESAPFPPMVQEAVGTAAGSGAADAVGSTVQLAASLTTMSSGGATLTVTPDWAVLRSELNARLDVIEAGLQAVAPVIQHFETAYRESARIGHNNPPEDIDLLPIGLAELQLGILAANLARSEINSDHPRFDVLRLCGLVLRSTGGLIFACIKWWGKRQRIC